MVIDYSSLTSSQTASSRGKVAQPAGSAVSGKDSGASSTTPSNAGDTVKLSSTAKALLRSEQTLNSSPDVDSERVEKLKAEIEGGTYQVNGQRVAEGIMRYESLMS